MKFMVALPFLTLATNITDNLYLVARVVCLFFSPPPLLNPHRIRYLQALLSILGQLMLVPLVPRRGQAAHLGLLFLGIGNISNSYRRSCSCRNFLRSFRTDM